ncbi:MAG: ribose-5-phosphate isomerase RpiA [Beijerinckiaceae bacterium]|nr:ribose-5-phosphate isomerase RpiA [Beijerinckiaceae bacterium]
MNLEDLKREAAARAVALVKDGMKLGLGTGSTAKHFVDLLGERVKNENLRVIGVPTSEATRQQAAALGIPLSTLDETPELDLTIDGADEIDPQLRLIKGGGGAHLREKIVALASKRMIVIADATKEVETLGRFPLPLEVIPFGLPATQRQIAAIFARHGLQGEMTMRMKDGAPFRTDSGNCVLDAHLARIPDPDALALHLDGVTGLVEHGLFIGIAKGAFLATPSGIKTLGSVA